MMIIVTGIPRSGTSAMMRVLKAGGVPVLHDDVVTADEWNPHGYYEYSKAHRIDEDASWLVPRDAAVKVHYDQLRHVPRDGHRFIFVRRDTREIADSHDRMARSKGCPLTVPMEYYAEYLGKLEQQMLSWLPRPGSLEFNLSESPVEELCQLLPQIDVAKAQEELKRRN